MTTRPATRPLIATDATFATGPDVGQPVRVSMSAGERAQGAIASARFPAAKFNGLLGLLGDWSDWQDDVLANRAMRDWAQSNLPVSGQVMGLLAPLNLGYKARGVVAVGYDPADTDDVRFCRSFGSGRFEGTLFDPSRFNGPVCCAGGVAGTFIWSEVGGAVIVARSALGVVETAEALAVHGQPVALHYAEFCTKYLAATTTGKIQHGVTIPAIVDATVPAGLTAIGTADQLGTPGGEFADDGVGNIVFVGSCVISGVTAVRIFHSSDAGVTWVLARTYGGAITSANVVWHGASGQFVALDSSGGVSRSATGSTWPAATVIGALSVANGAIARYGSMAAAGHAIAKLYDPLLFGSFTLGGIAYSLDAGVSWRYQSITDRSIFGSANLLSLIGIGGHMYASDGARVYRSGLLSFTDADV